MFPRFQAETTCFCEKEAAKTWREDAGAGEEAESRLSVLEMRLAVQDLRVEHGQDAGERFPERQSDPG